MNDLDPTVPLHYEPAPIGAKAALAAKGHALEQALGEIERLKAQVADLQHRIDLLLNSDGTLLGAEARDG